MADIDVDQWLEACARLALSWDRRRVRRGSWGDHSDNARPNGSGSPVGSQFGLLSLRQS